LVNGFAALCIRFTLFDGDVEQLVELTHVRFEQGVVRGGATETCPGTPDISVFLEGGHLEFFFLMKTAIQFLYPFEYKKLERF
jgi:hypothetical protein